MQHVWIINHYAQVPSGAGGVRHYGLASHLSHYGWTTSLIAASVEHITGRQRLTGRLLRKLETVAGVQCLWLRTPSYQGNGFGRILNMATYVFMILLPGMTRGLPRPDLIIGSSVHPFAAWAAALLARRYRVPFVFEVRDLWPTTLIDMGKISSSGLSARILFRLERWLVRRAALTVVLMSRAAEYYTALGVDASRILVLPNGAEVASVSPPPTVERDCFTLMYCGAMGAANSLETLIDALVLVERHWQGPVNFQCRLIGDGPERSLIEARATGAGLKSVSFESPVAKEKVSELLLEADAFVITLKDMPNLYRFGISMNKIFDYMAAGRPTIMAAEVPDNPLGLSGGGEVVLPESPTALSEAILHLLRTKKIERDKMGQDAWRYVFEHHHYAHLAERLAMAMNDIVGESDKNC